MTENDENREGGVVVVGVDDSRGAKAALVFAFRDAARRAATVRVVGAYVPPDFTQVWLATSRGADLTEDDGFSVEVRAGVERMVAEVRAELAGEPMPDRVEVVVAAGPPAPTLLEMAGDADLLVVGSRGRGGFASMTLGSVSLQCVMHARCPVTVVRGGAAAHVKEKESAAGRQRFEPLRLPLL